MMYDSGKYSDCEEIYHGDCECYLHDCISRSFVVYDVFHNNNLRIKVCNTYLRLLIQEEQYKRTGYRLPHVEVIRGIINNYIPIRSYRSHQRKSNIKEIYISSTVCNRPYISTDISLLDAISCVIESHDNRSRWNKPHDDLIYSIIHELNKICEYYLKYAKYKSDHTQVKSIMKKLSLRNKHYFTKEELETKYNDLFIKFINLKSNSL